MKRRHTTNAETKKRVPIYKDCAFKIVVGKKEFFHAFRAEPGKAYVAEDCEQMLENVVKYCDEKLPTLEFRMVQLAVNRFNLIAVGVKPRKGTTDGIENDWEKAVLKAADQAVAKGTLDPREPEHGGGDRSPGEAVPDGHRDSEAGAPNGSAAAPDGSAARASEGGDLEKYE